MTMSQEESLRAASGGRFMSTGLMAIAAAARGAVEVQDPVCARVQRAQKSAHLRPKRHLHSVRQHVDAAKHRQARARRRGRSPNINRTEFSAA